VAILALLVLFPSMARAGLPLDTEDTGTAERVELEVAAVHESVSDGDGGDLAVTVNVGLLANLEASVAGTLAVDDPAGSATEIGLGDTTLGVKYRFLDEAAPWPALLARFTLELPTGDEARGLGEGDASVGLLLAASRTWGPVILTGNAGYTITTGDADADVVLLGASVVWAVRGPWSVVGEVVGEIAVGRNADDQALIRVGFTWDVFNAGDAKGLLRQATLAGAVAAGLTSASPDVVVTLGLTLVY
jgi:hypothetical protein